jgi:hypothetical protein
MGGWLDIGTGRIRSRGGCGGFGRNFGGPLDLFANCGYFFLFGVIHVYAGNGGAKFLRYRRFFLFLLVRNDDLLFFVSSLAGRG